jgi:hypothetical protein
MLLIRIWVIAIPPISLAFVVQFNILLIGIKFISSDVSLSPLGSNLSWPLDTFLGLVRHGTTVLTGTFSKLGYDLLLAISFLVPVVDLLPLVLLYPLMEEYSLFFLAFAIFAQVPRSLLDELWHVLEINVLLIFFSHYYYLINLKVIMRGS